MSNMSSELNVISCIAVPPVAAPDAAAAAPTVDWYDADEVADDADDTDDNDADADEDDAAAVSANAAADEANSGDVSTM